MIGINFAFVVTLVLSIAIGFADCGGESGGGRPTDTEIQSLPPLTLEEIAQEFDAVKAANPNVDVKSAKFSRLLFDHLKTPPNNNNNPQTDPSKLLVGLLTKEEVKLLLLNSFNIPLTVYAAKEATDLAPTVFPEGPSIVLPEYLTKADAFRHAYWNALMAKHIDQHWAEEYANAHESTLPSSDDKNMDLSNNAAGRRIQADNPTAVGDQLSNLVRNTTYQQIQANVTIDPTRLVYIRPYQIARVDVTPLNPHIAVGGIQPLSVTFKDSAGQNIQVISEIVEWDSLRKNVVSSPEHDGLSAKVRGLSTGSSIVIALELDGDKTGKTIVTVGPTFDGTYTKEYTTSDGSSHTDSVTVTGLSVSGSHSFSSESQAGSWTWSGTITVSSSDPSAATITGTGTRTDQCCGSINFTLDKGGIKINNDGSADLFYGAYDPRFKAPFGENVKRPPNQ